MSNPFNMLNPANPYNANNMSGFRSVYQSIMNSRNPTEAFIQMARGNPQLQPAIQMLQQGINPQQIFNTLCQQRGINPTEFLKNITGK